jgi:hypothetical protein
VAQVEYMSAAVQTRAGVSLNEANARRMLKEAVHDCRLLGGVFVTLGTLLIAWLVTARVPGGRWIARLMLGTNGVMLVAPGVWYLTASMFIKRAEPWAVRISYYVIAAQFALVGLAFGFLWLDRTRVGSMMMLPAMLNIFFLPALLGLIWCLVKARRAMNLMMPTSHAFQPLVPGAAIPVALAPQQAGPATTFVPIVPPEPSQLSDNVRPK